MRERELPIILLGHFVDGAIFISGGLEGTKTSVKVPMAGHHALGVCCCVVRVVVL